MSYNCPRSGVNPTRPQPKQAAGVLTLCARRRTFFKGRGTRIRPVAGRRWPKARAPAARRNLKEVSKRFDTLNHEKLLNLLRGTEKDEQATQRIPKRLARTGFFERTGACESIQSACIGRAAPAREDVYAWGGVFSVGPA